MLNKILMGAAVSAAALTATAGSTAAENYQILMMDYAFFPEISYVQPGDTVTFVNMSGITRVIEAKNGSWSTPEIADGGEATISIEQGMMNTFKTKIDGVGGNGVTDTSSNGGDDVTDVSDGTEGVDGQTAEEGTIIGNLNFSAPPTIATN